MNLKTPITTLGVTYKMYGKRLEKLEIKTAEDFIFHIPARYENYTLVSPIRLLQAGEVVTIKGTIQKANNEFTKYGKRVQKITVSDETKSIDCVWFNQPFVLRSLKVGDSVSFAGKVTFYQKKPVLQVESYELLTNLDSETFHTGRLVPVYPETRGLSSKWIRNRIREMLPQFKNEFYEYLPESIIAHNNLIDYKTAIVQIHFPQSLELSEQAKQRLSFDELFLTQLAAKLKRMEWEKKKVSHFCNISQYKKHIQQFWEKLPFELTGAQKRAVREIFADLASTKPMNRLLEGDVGSGKTVVAAIAMYVAFLNGFQSVLMAPTEILANQHYETISRLLSTFGLNIGLVTGSKKLKNIKPVSNKTTNNESQITNHNILVGTHALLSEKVTFDNLGLVVIDEQQRFGVEQRAILREKGINPHFLTMTATPIPRTIFLTLYGDLDLSYLDEMPIGRQKIKTYLVPKAKRGAAYEWIKKKIREKDEAGRGNQVFIICPFIEESETMKTVKAAVKEYEQLESSVFNEYKLGLLHGKLKAGEKQKILTDFRDGNIDILVATPVVEVGIDIPNATIMMIEASERFGLAQLHQLRGRVGRSSRESFCLLFTNSFNPKTIERLKYLERTHVGAELAELDLRLRGPGEVYGTVQHGAATLKIASFSDFKLIEKTRMEVEKIFPKLPQYPKLLEKIKTFRVENVAPD